MKKAKKVLVLLLCAVLLVGASIAGTVAYLTDTDNVVENTFTVGKVVIDLDETDVDEYGVKDGNTRVKANSYTLVPGRNYVKDPTVHVDADSEDCYIFVKVENEIANIEVATSTKGTIAEQIVANNWTALAGQTGVYYKTWKQGDAADLVVFEEFTIKTDVNGETLDKYTGKTVNVTAYAIQLSGFESDVEGAWAAVSAAG